MRTVHTVSVTETPGKQPKTVNAYMYEKHMDKIAINLLRSTQPGQVASSVIAFNNSGGI
jgi:hypothetical protein